MAQREEKGEGQREMKVREKRDPEGDSQEKRKRQAQSKRGGTERRKIKCEKNKQTGKKTYQEKCKIGKKRTGIFLISKLPPGKWKMLKLNMPFSKGA